MGYGTALTESDEPRSCDCCLTGERSGHPSLCTKGQDTHHFEYLEAWVSSPLLLTVVIGFSVSCDEPTDVFGEQFIVSRTQYVASQYMVAPVIRPGNLYQTLARAVQLLEAFNDPVCINDRVFRGVKSQQGLLNR